MIHVIIVSLEIIIYITCCIVMIFIEDEELRIRCNKRWGLWKKTHIKYSTERDIPWSITVIVVMSRRVMGIKILNSCRWSVVYWGGNETPGVNLVIKCVVLQVSYSDKMYRWNFLFISPILFQVLSQIPLRIKKKHFYFFPQNVKHHWT